MRKKKLTAVERLELAKAKAKALKNGTEVRTITEEQLAEKDAVQRMADVYECLLGTYIHKKMFKYVTRVDKHHRAYKSFQKAIKFAEELSVDFETYMAAQFYYAHKWFGTYPKSFQIALEKTKCPAKERVKLYLREVAGTTEDEPVVSRATRTGKAPREMRHRNSELVMRRFMKSYSCTEEEIFTMFTPALAYFDQSWLNQNESYQKVKKQLRHKKG